MVKLNYKDWGNYGLTIKSFVRLAQGILAKQDYWLLSKLCTLKVLKYNLII